MPDPIDLDELERMLATLPLPLAARCIDDLDGPYFRYGDDGKQIVEPAGEFTDLPSLGNMECAAMRLADVQAIVAIVNAVPGLIARVRAAEAKWIAVADRLPDTASGDGVWVVAQTEAGNVQPAYFIRYELNGGVQDAVWCNDRENNLAVAYWQPLPAALARRTEPT